MSGLLKIFCSKILFNSKPNYGRIFLRTKTKFTGFDRDFIIVRTTPKDYDSVMDLVKLSYFNNEPTLVAIGLAYKTNAMLEDKIVEGLSQGMTLMAKCRDTGDIVGAAINTTTCAWDPNQMEEFAHSCTCPKLSEWFKFQAFVTSKGNLWEKYNEKKVFEVSYLATDTITQKRGIGLNLVKKSLELGKDLTYNVLRVDATSLYSQKICKKLNMHMIYEIPYKAYRGSEGRALIIPPAPHNSLQVYISLPHATPEQLKELKT